MIRTLLLLFFFSSSLYADHHLEDEKIHSSDYQANLRFFKKLSKVKFTAEYTHQLRESQSDYKHFRLLGRYRLSKHFHFGLGAKTAWGIRHDEDWRLKDGSWSWWDSIERNENIIQTQISYRTMLPTSFDAIFEMRLLYEYNLFNDNQSINIRPGINWILTPDHVIYTQVQAYIPLNYSEHSIYQWFVYTGYLYRVNKKFKLGPLISFGETTWTQVDQTYEIHQHLNIGMNFNFYF